MIIRCSETNQFHQRLKIIPPPRFEGYVLKEMADSQKRPQVAMLSFDVLVTALEACPEVPTMDVVVDRLLHEERKLGQDHGERAMTAR